MNTQNANWNTPASMVRDMTDAIWTRRGLCTAVSNFYSRDAIRRTPAGCVQGGASAARDFLAAAEDFRDRQVLTEDVIALGGAAEAICSQRLMSCASPTAVSGFATVSGKPVFWRSLADRVIRDDMVVEEWVIDDTAALLRATGQNPREWVVARLKDGPIAPPLTPQTDISGLYRGGGNDNDIGRRLVDVLGNIMSGEAMAFERGYDPACALAYPGGAAAYGPRSAEHFWLPLRASFPEAEFEVHHVIGLQEELMPPRAAVRWSLTGGHDGWGTFGAPSGRAVHVMGITHAEFGPLGLRREWTLIDETSIWAQVLGDT